MLFADGDIAGAGDVDRKAARKVLAEYLKHPGFGNPAAPVESHLLGDGGKTQSGIEIEVASLDGACTEIHGDGVSGRAWTKRFDRRLFSPRSMAPDGVGARLFDVSREQPGVVLQPEFRPRGSDPEHSGGRDDRDDRERDDHLRDRKPALLRRCFAVGFHLRDYLRQANPGPVLARAVPGMITR